MATQQAHSSAVRVATMAGMLGAGLALLFAPRSGRETRDRLKLASHRMKHQTKDKLAVAKHQVEDSAHAAIEMKDRARAAVRAGKQSAKETYQELQKNRAKDSTDETMPSDLPVTNESEA